VKNPFIQVYPGDFLQAAAFKFCTSSAVLAALGFLAGSLSRAARGQDAAAFLEIDELTLTVSVLWEPQGLLELDQSCLQVPYLTYRMYNWKYAS
jgi:hypothetical protein